MTWRAYGALLITSDKAIIDFARYLRGDNLSKAAVGLEEHGFPSP